MIRLLHALFLALFFILSTSAATAKVTVTYFHNDISGSPMLATDAAGNQVWKESYRPYGQKLRDEPASRDGKNKIGFAGSPFDASTGLSYMGARYYDPVTGRFMGVDPVGFQEGNVHSFNRYAYANNNPYRYIDPDGRQAVELVWNRAFNTNRLIAPANGAPGFELAKQGIVQGLIEGAKLSAEVGMTVSPLGAAARSVTVAKRFGDLTISEIRQIQLVVNEAGRPLEVVGSAATGSRRGVGTNLPLGKGQGTRSDIDYVVPPSSLPHFEGLQGKLPSIDPNTGIIPGVSNPNIGSSIRFEPK